MPPAWRDYRISWGPDNVPPNEQWPWPRLDWFLSGSGGDESYGSVDPGTGIHNDYAAIVIREYDSYGQETIRTRGTGAGTDVTWPGPLISTTWLPLHSFGAPATHDIRSVGFKLNLGYTYKVWIVMADMFSNPFAGAPEEGSAGGTIVYFEIDEVGRINQKWPPPSTGYFWDKYPPEDRL